MVTPRLLIDDSIVIKGRVPSVDELSKLLRA